MLGRELPGMAEVGPGTTAAVKKVEELNGKRGAGGTSGGVEMEDYDGRKGGRKRRSRSARSRSRSRNRRYSE